MMSCICLVFKTVQMETSDWPYEVTVFSVAAGSVPLQLVFMYP